MLQTKFNDYYTISGTGKTYDIKIDPCTRTAKTFHEEVKWNAEYVYNHKQGDVCVFYSGGIDSEYILEVFLSMGMKVTPVIVRYENDYNLHDIKYAFDYCESRNLKPIVIDINFQHFVESGRYLELAQSVNCVTWQFPSLMEAVLKVDGTHLMGDAEPHFYKDKFDGLWYFNEMERTMAFWDRFYRKYQVPGTHCLLSFTPETIVGFMNDPLINDILHDKVPGKDGTNTSKIHVYNRFLNSITPRTKYTGFENIRQSGLFMHPDVQKVYTNPVPFGDDGNGIFILEQYKLREVILA